VDDLSRARIIVSRSHAGMWPPQLRSASNGLLRRI
jgi:hypothetical protein